jgi:hypothetical protein
MPNYPSSFISGIAPGARAVDNVADKREIKFTQAVSVAFTAAGTVGTPATIHAATTANIALTGAQTIDGVSVSAGNFVLVKNQTNAFDNGIYTAASGAWSRNTSFDTSAKLLAASNFKFVAVNGGTVNGAKVFVLRNILAGFTLGIDAVRFEELPAVAVYNSVAKYPTDVNVGVAATSLATETWEDFLKVKDQIVAACTAFDTAYAALVAETDYDARSLVANETILSMRNLQKKFEKNTFEFNRLVLDMTQILAAGNATPNISLAAQTSRYPSGQRRGY